MTDERYVPWSNDFCTGYEHIHRYVLAKQYVSGKRVLDLACGEGYGSYMLATTAADVVGVDINDEVIAHANEIYKKSNLSFIAGEMTQVLFHDDFTFDVIVCFEALEHIDKQEELLHEIKRLLRPDGIFIVSTPNKPVYSENGTRQNPFHLKELDLNQFQKLLKNKFRHVLLYGQKTYACSKIFPLANGEASPSHSLHQVTEHLVKKKSNGFELVAEEDPLPRYFIAIGSDGPIAPSEAPSYLADISIRNGYVKWEIPDDPRLGNSSILRSAYLKIKSKYDTLFNLSS